MPGWCGRGEASPYPEFSRKSIKQIEKKLTDKEKDVINCAKGAFKKEEGKSYSIAVVIEIGPGKKIGKITFSPGGKTDEYKAFGKCVERKFKGITFPDVGKATVTMNRNYSVSVTTEK